MLRHRGALAIALLLGVVAVNYGISVHRSAPAIPLSATSELPPRTAQVAERDSAASGANAAEDRSSGVETGERRSGIGDLAELDLAEDPRRTSEAIVALSHRAAEEKEATRDEIARLFTGWLRAELRRNDPAARGHVSQLIDALGDTGSRDAVSPLAELLSDDRLPLHIRIRAVDSLSALGLGGGEEIMRFSRRLEQTLPDDEPEVVEEGREIVARALVRVGDG